MRTSASLHPWRSSRSTECVLPSGELPTSSIAESGAPSLAVVPDCGHVSNLENPQMFNDILRGFLRRHAA